MMDCEQVRLWLERDLDGAAEPSGDVAAHLDRCRACAAEAGRTKAIAEAARAALPPADVPVDFTEQVLDEVLEPAGDQRLAAAARPRLRRWLPLVAVAALLPLAFLLRPAPKIHGDLRVERDGEWVASKSASPGEMFGLEPGGAAERGEIRITAQEITLLQEEEGTVMLLAGDVTLESSALTVTDTPLGEIRLQADSVCLATLECEGEVEMQFVDLKKAVPAVLTVSLLAGGATVVNAQGAQPVKPGERVIVEGSNPPRLDPVAVQRELDRLRAELEGARKQIAALQGPKVARSADARRQIDQLDQAANANRMAIMQLSSDVEYLRLEKDSPENRARIAELEEALRQRIEVAKVHDETRQALEKRLVAEEILKESRDLTRMAEELQEEIEKDEVSDKPFEAGRFDRKGVYVVEEDGTVRALPVDWPKWDEAGAADAEKAALKAEIARLKSELAKRERAERFGKDRLDLKEHAIVTALAERLAFQRAQRAALERELLEKPDDEDLQSRRAAQRKQIEAVEVELAAAKFERVRRARKELRATIAQLENEIEELREDAANANTLERIKHLESLLKSSKRELAQGMLAGRVLAVQDDMIVLSLRGEDGVERGWKFDIYRENQWTGRAVVTEVQRDRCIARIELTPTDKKITPQKGDLVKRTY